MDLNFRKIAGSTIEISLPTKFCREAIMDSYIHCKFHERFFIPPKFAAIYVACVFNCAKLLSCGMLVQGCCNANGDNVFSSNHYGMI